MSNLSRRNFLRMTGAAAAAMLLPHSLGTVRAQDVTLNVQLRSSFIPTNNELMTSLLNAWAGKNGAKLDLSLLNHQQMADTLATAAASGAGPDVLETVDIKPHQYAEALADVSDICEKIGEENGGWYDVARDICYVDGVWRAMPHFLAAHAMVYRKDLFKEAGYETFPATWDDLLKAGTKLKAMGKPIGFSLGHAGGDGNNFVYSLLWSFGASVTDDKGVVSLDSAATKTATEFVQQLFNDAMPESVLSWDDGANNRALLAGEVACTNNASSILWTGLRDKVEFIAEVSHASYPAGPAGLVQFLELNTIQILNFSPNVEKAKALLAYINSPDVWLPLGPDGYAFLYPLLKGWEDHPAMPWNTNPALSAFKGLAATGKAMGYPGKPSKQASEVATNFLVNDMFAQVAAGALSVEESIKQTTEAVKQIYGQ